MGTNVLGSLASCKNHAPPLHTVYSLIPLACSQQILSCRGGQRACACCKLGNLSLRLRARHEKKCYRTRGFRGLGQIALVSFLGNADWCRDPNFCGKRQHRRSSGAVGREKSTVVYCEGKNGVGNKSVVVVGSENGGTIHKENEDDLLVGGDGDTTDHVATAEVEGDDKDSQVLRLKELLRLAHLDLEKARINSTQVETEAQKVAETAIALRDEADAAICAAESAKSLLESQLLQESSAKEALEKSKLVLCAVKARLKSIEEAVEDARIKPETGTVKLEAMVQNVETELGNASLVETKVEVILTKEQQAAQLDLQSCEETLKNFEIEILRIQNSKLELQKEVARLSELADEAKTIALAADEDVASAMSLAEKAVALEVEAAQRLSDAEIALQKAESQFGDAHSSVEAVEAVIIPASRVVDVLPLEEKRPQEVVDGKQTEELVVEHADGPCSRAEDLLPVMEVKSTDKDLSATSNDVVDTSVDFEKKAKEILDNKMPDSEPVEVLAGAYSRKNEGKDTGDSGTPKSFTKKSSRFFPASFFSFDEGEEFSPSSVFTGFLSTVRQHFPKVVVGGLLLLGGGVYLGGKVEKLKHVVQSYEITTNIEEVATTTKPLIKKLYKLPSRIKMHLDKLSPQEVNEEEASLFDVLWLLLASVVFVPIFQKIPGGSPVLGYLAAGILIGPHSLHIIRNVHGTKAIAEFGVVFLLFNIGLELSVERLSSMRKYVFGFGSGQVLGTALAAGLFAHYVSGLSVPAAIVIGNGLALSSTAVVLQVLQERGESTSRHGRAAFSVLLFQDLAVVVLLILIPLISPNSSKGGVGFNAIAEALGIAAIKGVIAISGIIAGGRLLLRPIYRSMAENHNAEIFAANTLLVVLGTSVFTARAGLSMALGAFLAGLLLSETEFALQVESDIAPYRGLLLGLFFMTVGMSIDPQLFVARFPVIMGALALLIGGKTLLIASLGRQFGLSTVAAVRTGLLLAPGGEFAFVAFGEAVNQGIMSHQLSSLMFLVVGLSMAITPWLAAAGQVIASKFEQQDVRSLLPAENETDDLQGHIIVCGFGRVGQIISQMLSERLIPFVALDVRSERVSMGRTLDLPVYFGDAGSREVLHKLGAERAAAAVITLDTPGANYRAVWALSKYFPKVKTYVRAHDVDHGINLEKAGATAVVPETLEPSLQLAAAVLAEAKLPASEIGATINEFRSRHLAELTELTKTSGTSLGYGYFQTVAAKQAGAEAVKGKIDDDGTADRRFEGVVAVP